MLCLRKPILCCSLIAVCVFPLIEGQSRAGTRFTSPLGYSIELPAGWLIENDTTNKDLIYDTSQTRPSYLAVVAHPWTDAEFASCSSWTSSHFTSYLITARYGVDPWGGVRIFDSTATQDGRWAPYIYAQFFASDTGTVTWAEYVVYTSTKYTGYEMYAIGDTADMDANLALYGGILQTVQLADTQLSIDSSPNYLPRGAGHAKNGHAIWFDLRGRSQGPLNPYFRQNRAPVVVLSPGTKLVPLPRRGSRRGPQTIE